MNKILICLIIILAGSCINSHSTKLDLKEITESETAANGRGQGGTAPFSKNLKRNTVRIGDSISIEYEGDNINIYGAFGEGRGVENVIYFEDTVVHSQSDDKAINIIGALTSTAVDNKVDITGSKIELSGEGSSLSICGASSFEGNSNNKVVIKGTLVSSSEDATLLVLGGGSMSDASNNNKVSIYESKIVGNSTICGGRAGGEGDAKGNKVYIYPGSEIEGTITAAMVANGIAKNNEILILNTGEGVKVDNAQIAGFIVVGDGSGTGENNSLKILVDEKPFELSSVDKIDKISIFFLGKEILESGNFVMFFNGEDGIDSSRNLGCFEIGLGPNIAFKEGESINFIQCNYVIDMLDLTKKETTGTVYTPLKKYETKFKIEQTTPNTITATLVARHETGNPKAVSYLSGRASVIQFLNQQVVDFGQNFITYDNEVLEFTKIEGMTSEYWRQGVRIDGVRVIVGIGKNFRVGGDNGIVGTYIELGEGWYKSKNESESPYDSWQVNANGNNKYMGIGVVGKICLNKDHGRLDRSSLEASISAGNVQTDYQSKDLGITIPLEEIEEQKLFGYRVGYLKLNLGCGHEFSPKRVLNKVIYPQVLGRWRIVCLGRNEIQLPVYKEIDEKLTLPETFLNNITIGVNGGCDVGGKCHILLEVLVGQSIGEIGAEIIDLSPFSLTGRTVEVKGEVEKSISIKGKEWFIRSSIKGRMGQERGVVINAEVKIPIQLF
jgi:hypothetical protein